MSVRRDLRTVLPLTGGIRGGVVHLVSTLGSAVSSALRGEGGVEERERAGGVVGCKRSQCFDCARIHRSNTQPHTPNPQAGVKLEEELARQLQAARSSVARQAEEAEAAAAAHQCLAEEMEALLLAPRGSGSGSAEAAEAARVRVQLREPVETPVETY
jgi:hypothetical protein